MEIVEFESSGGRGGENTLPTTPTHSNSCSRTATAPVVSPVVLATDSNHVLTESQKPNLMMSETETYKVVQVRHGDRP